MAGKHFHGVQAGLGMTILYQRVEIALSPRPVWRFYHQRIKTIYSMIQRCRVMSFVTNSHLPLSISQPTFPSKIYAYAITTPSPHLTSPDKFLPS